MSRCRVTPLCRARHTGVGLRCRFWAFPVAVDVGPSWREGIVVDVRSGRIRQGGRAASDDVAHEDGGRLRRDHSAHGASRLVRCLVVRRRGPNAGRRRYDQRQSEHHPDDTCRCSAAVGHLRRGARRQRGQGELPPGSRVVFASDRDGNLEICSMSGGRLVAAAAHVQSATTPNRPGHPTSAASSL